MGKHRKSSIKQQGGVKETPETSVNTTVTTTVSNADLENSKSLLENLIVRDIADVTTDDNEEFRNNRYNITGNSNLSTKMTIPIGQHGRILPQHRNMKDNLTAENLKRTGHNTEDNLLIRAKEEIGPITTRQIPNIESLNSSQSSATITDNSATITDNSALSNDAITDNSALSNDAITDNSVLSNDAITDNSALSNDVITDNSDNLTNIFSNSNKTKETFATDNFATISGINADNSANIMQNLQPDNCNKSKINKKAFRICYIIVIMILIISSLLLLLLKKFAVTIPITTRNVDLQQTGFANNSSANSVNSSAQTATNATGINAKISGINTANLTNNNSKTLNVIGGNNSKTLNVIGCSNCNRPRDAKGRFIKRT